MANDPRNAMTRRPAGASAFAKDVWRTITHNLGRFLSILVITALGVTMATGLRASCVDLRYSADTFFDDRNLHDIIVVSTLGLTDDDVLAMAAVDGVAQAAGVHGEDVSVTVGGKRGKATMTALNDSGIDRPHVIDGRLPRTATEVAVTEPYLADSGKTIGDTLTISDARSDDSSAERVFARHDYTIVGTVIDPTDVNNSAGATAFRSSASATDYGLFVDESAVDPDMRDTYTSVAVIVDGARNLQTYDDAYRNLIDTAEHHLDTIREQREQARTDTVKADANAEIDDRERQANDKIADARSKLDAAQHTLNGQRAQLDAQREMFTAASGGISPDQAVQAGVEGAEQLQDAQRRLDSAQATLDRQRRQLDDNAAKTAKTIADARAEADDIATAQWYVRDRNALGGYSSIDSDAKSIESIGTAFPVLFLLVAVLISLTAITRMVEEERLLIGTYKALGYRRREILRKYVIYAALACLLGGLLGDLLGFIALPGIIFTIFETMYLLPAFLLRFDWTYGIGAAMLFLVVIVGSAVWSCRGELRESPASLLRPKAPKAGKTILMERIRPLWRRMTFLNKVTIRNLFRYKSRAFMTIAGITGCTMLLMCGFAIKDSVTELAPNQYGGVTAYDLMAVTTDDDNAAALRGLRDDSAVRDVLGVRIESATLSAASSDSAADGEETVQLVVVPDGANLDGYIHLREAQSDWSAAMGGGAKIDLDDSGVVVTKNAQQMLGLTAGRRAHLKDASLRGADMTVDAVAENYLGNSVFMTQRLYERLYGDYHANAMLAHLAGNADERIRFADGLARSGDYLSVTSTDELVRDFTKNFTLINTVVYVLLVLAGALAFVVLFTLSTTNISERERELATIKVLGFRRGEVRHYVNKEMLILTGIGVAVGLPLGRLAGEGLTMVLRMPSIYFAVHVHWESYAISAALALVFAVLVTFVTNRMLDRIDMVGALKSPE
ncbi:FtsX-like permease family protein [Bifidobacterium sp. 82T24]|uniref:FtsX-like permease family protein n=1 Tax=Bifidobacterium pluvialisilvae TaxID=2834436 RepID=UPI001C56D8C6|nr:FtsX-like permease family protein [Bifidobacterium pluvialisilvae]MBW3087307.1 FtsX-like permease family protein [Bifidobacterium pluvialisilvae]